jgi:DNA-binding beta-propeller fold protein YncE
LRTLGRLAALTLAIYAAAPAVAQSDPPRTLDDVRRLADAKPGHTGALYVLAASYAASGDAKEALAWLGRLVRAGSGVDPAADPAFAKIASEPGFEALAAEARRRAPRVGSAPVAFRIADREFFPEGIAYDPDGRTFYVSSTRRRKITAVDERGRAREFAGPEDGLSGVLGLRVDPQRGHLWAASTAGVETGKPKGESALYCFDLRTGDRVARHALDGEAGKHQLNDLVVDPRGTVYATDSEAGAVYALEPGASRLEPLLAPGSAFGANGIAISDDGRYLFVAHFGGVARVRVDDRSRLELPFPGGVTPFGIDGLYFHRGDLVGVENVASPGRVVRYELSDARDRVVATRVLEAGHPSFALPTTGAVARGALYVIANSFVDRLAPDGTITSPETVREVEIVRVGL